MAETISAAASIATFLVIAVTAIAAIIQLRHLRQNNQLNALLTILRMPYDPVLHDALEFIDSELPDRLNDREFMQQLDKSPVNRKVHKELDALDYYERVGAYIKANLIDAGVYFDCSSPERYWDALKPVIKAMRSQRGPSTYENFEYLILLAQRWDRNHPEGNYPPNAQRLSLD